MNHPKQKPFDGWPKSDIPLLHQDKDNLSPSRICLTDGAIIFGPHMEHIAAMYANEAHHSPEIVKRYNAYPELLSVLRILQIEAQAALTDPNYSRGKLQIAANMADDLASRLEVKR